jgi:hypothetical protein
MFVCRKPDDGRDCSGWKCFVAVCNLIATPALASNGGTISKDLQAAAGGCRLRDSARRGSAEQIWPIC